MITKATITIDSNIKDEASKKAKSKQIRGGLSGLIELLLSEFLKKEEIELNK